MYMKLSGNDKKILETLFNMRDGYVLDFSDRRMTEFFNEEFGINVYDEKYDFDFPSKSKANSLRGIWLKEDVMVVGQIILSLVDYLETSLLVEGKEIPQNTKDLIQNGREIGARMLFNEMAKGNEPIIKAITDKTALIKNFNSIDYKALKTNEKIYLLKVLYSYYEAIIRTYYGSGLFFLNSGIDDLNDYFKVLRKRIIEIIASDNTFLEIKNSHAYTQIIEPITSLYSSAEFLDVIWDDAVLPSIINMREDIADKDLFENQSEVHQEKGIGLQLFLEAIKREMGMMKKYMDQRTKSFYATDLPKHKEAFEKASSEPKKEEVVKHEHTHRFENNIQEKEIVLNHKFEDGKPSTKYITKKGDDFYYKGLNILVTKKNNDYYKVFCALYAKLPDGGEISYKDLIAEIKSRMPEQKNKTDEEMQKFIQRNLTDRSNGFMRYAKIPKTEDNGKPLISVTRASGVVFNNKTG